MKKYILAVIVAEVIVLFFFALPFRYVLPSQAPIFTAIGGLLFSVPIAYSWRIYTEPVLQIKEEVEQRGITVEQTRYGFAGEEYNRWNYIANRIIVENSGRSAAKNCKAWILTEKSKERVCWTVPKERPNATINVKDAERLDFCSYYKEGPENYNYRDIIKRIPKIYISDENQLPVLIETANLKSVEGLTDCKVLITSDNADAIEAKVIFEDNKIKIES
ncbi:MAG: hypothetical protein O8C61_02535 [Candidatus Methanoperedens sp.]|nr:hypothetical protein [Candidatus Methanoperedens sp.]